jgi:hypothetical protein
MGIDYKLDYAMYSGDSIAHGTTTKTDIDASMWDATVGYSMPAMMNFHVWLGMHSDSGTKSGETKHKTYNPFHYDAHENAGQMDILGWGNLTYQRVGVSINPTDDIGVNLEYLKFTKTEKTGDSYGNAGYSDLATALTTTAGEDDLGNEIDLTVTKKYTNNFTTAASYRMFQAGDAFGSGADDASQIYLEGKLTF